MGRGSAKNIRLELAKRYVYGAIDGEIVDEFHLTRDENPFDTSSDYLKGKEDDVTFNTEISVVSPTHFHYTSMDKDKEVASEKFGDRISFVLSIIYEDELGKEYRVGGQQFIGKYYQGIRFEEVWNSRVSSDSYKENTFEDMDVDYQNNDSEFRDSYDSIDSTENPSIIYECITEE
jgi:hypothetical protein